MFWLLITFTLVLQISIATASFHCIKCAQTLILDSSESINAHRPECALKSESSTMCMAVLQMDYEHNNASVLFDGFSQDSLNISNGIRMITHSMEISLATPRLTRSIQVYCSRNISCIDEIYDIHVSASRYGSQILRLQEDLQSYLYNSSNSADLLCENNQNQTVPCPNGFCQLINNGESSYTRNCIPEGFSAFSPSILIASSLVEEFENKSSFMYFCNQHRCNNLTTAEKVQGSLAQFGLLTPFNRQPIYVVETTTNKTSNGVVSRMVPQTIIGLQSILILLMMTFI